MIDTKFEYIVINVPAIEAQNELNRAGACGYRVHTSETYTIQVPEGYKLFMSFIMERVIVEPTITEPEKKTGMGAMRLKG